MDKKPQKNTHTHNYVSVSAPTAGETNELLVLTDMKGTAWAGYHGNRCTLHSMGAAVGFRCRTVFPSALIPSLSLMECSPSFITAFLLSSSEDAYSFIGVTTVSASKQQSAMTPPAVKALTQEERKFPI